MSDSYSQYERACYVCGQRSQHLHFWSSRLPEYELDGKPSRDGRWDLDRDNSAESCPHCGYVSADCDISIGDGEDAQDRRVPAVPGNALRRVAT